MYIFKQYQLLNKLMKNNKPQEQTIASSNVRTEKKYSDIALNDKIMILRKIQRKMEL